MKVEPEFLTASVDALERHLSGPGLIAPGSKAAMNEETPSINPELLIKVLRCNPSEKTYQELRMARRFAEFRETVHSVAASGDGPEYPTLLPRPRQHQVHAGDGQAGQFEVRP